MDNRHDGLKFSLYSSFLKGNAKVPQMPETSLRLRKLLASEHASLEQVTRRCTATRRSPHLLHSPRPMLRNLRQGVSLQEVISRRMQGMQRLNNLVLSFAIQHLFTSQDPALQKVFRARWNAALLCAAHSACLAQLLTRLPWRTRCSPALCRTSAACRCSTSWSAGPTSHATRTTCNASATSFLQMSG